MKRLGHYIVFFGLTGCTSSGAFLGDLPDQVISLAAPGQNLEAVKLEEDRCYWYEHDGPVETTMLPLMSKRGRHICISSAEAS